MDELTIDGKVYFSSKRAAAITGYAKDYVGQLCREGRVEARLVGRSWYVYEPSIMKHRFDQGEEEASVGAEEKEPQEQQDNLSEKTNKQAVFENTIYESEPIESITLPILSEEKEEGQLKEVEDSWKQWFSSDVTAPIEAPPGAGRREMGSEEEIVPIHRMQEPPTERIQVPIHRFVAEIVKDTASYAQMPARTVHVGNRGSKKGKYLIIKALLVGLMLISASIALIGTELGGALVGTNGGQGTILEFLAGISNIVGNI